MKNIISFLIILISFIAVADEKEVDKHPIVDSLLNCSPIFFDQIYYHKDNLEQYTSVKVFNSTQAYIPVSMQNNDSLNMTLFKKPMKYGNLEIKGYYDHTFNLDSYGSYYFWGFIIDGDIKKALKELDSIKWKTIEHDNLYIANSMIRYANDKLNSWRENNSISTDVKTVPAAGTIEKSLVLEKNSQLTLLSCSIQGSISSELLRVERPDLFIVQEEQLQTATLPPMPPSNE